MNLTTLWLVESESWVTKGKNSYIIRHGHEVKPSKTQVTKGLDQVFHPSILYLDCVFLYCPLKGGSTPQIKYTNQVHRRATHALKTQNRWRGLGIEQTALATQTKLPMWGLAGRIKLTMLHAF